MGRFDQYITGLAEIKVGNEELKLKIVIDDKRVFKSVVGKGTSVDNLKVIDDAILEILYRSYPDESKESLQELYNRYDTEFLNEILIFFKWKNREVPSDEKK
jgi:hypothetical protein